ncbi:MAG: NUDIX domain-containing protein [Bacillaceae bacterium]
MHIRNSVKALIIQDGKILLTKNKDDEGFFYLCPGGGQDHGETFHETLKRECLEEIGQSIEIGELLFIREYIGKNHEFAAFDAHVHQVEYYFSCNLKKDGATEPLQPDKDQVGIEWVPIQELMAYRLYPKGLRKYIMQHVNGENTPIYLGAIN